MGAVCCGKNSAVEPTLSTISRLPATKHEEIRLKSPPLDREYSSNASFTNLGISTIDPLYLIRGYENEPLVSLEEALAHFCDSIKDLSKYIKEAKTKCRFPSEHGLTRDESAAIYIYTWIWGNECLFDYLQKAWKSENREKLKPWFKYFKLFKSAFDKLPDAKGEIWQGKSLNTEKNLYEVLNSKTSPVYSAMGSCALSKGAVEEYLNNHGDEKKILLGFKSIGGKLVSPYAANGASDVLVWPGTKLGISKGEPFDSFGSVIFHITGSFSAVTAESIKTAQQIELHFLCRHDNCNCSIFTQFLMVFRINLLYFMVNDITK